MKSNNKITFIGHATLLLEVDGLRILTDPLLNDWILHLHRRSAAVKIEQYQMIDAVLISHLHLDHFNLSSLKKIGIDLPVILPKGGGKVLQAKGFKNIIELIPGDTNQIGALTVNATFAEHQGTRPPFGPLAGCLGFVIHGSQSIYFSGDTDIFSGMTDIAQNLDVALLPVWGWGPNLGPGHMNPQRAAEALSLLQPRIAIPIHWGTFYPALLGWLRRQLLIEPPHLFKQYANNINPNVKIIILEPGKALAI